MRPTDILILFHQPEPVETPVLWLSPLRLQFLRVVNVLLHHTVVSASSLPSTGQSLTVVIPTGWLREVPDPVTSPGVSLLLRGQDDVHVGQPEECRHVWPGGGRNTEWSSTSTLQPPIRAPELSQAGPVIA